MEQASPGASFISGDYEDVIRCELRGLREELAAEKECRRQTDAIVKNLESQLLTLMARLGKESKDTEAAGPMIRKKSEDECHGMKMMPVSERPSRELHETSTAIGLDQRGCYLTIEDMRHAQEDIEFEYKHLTQDMWGIGIMLFTRERFEIYRDGASLASIIRFVYASICVLLNLVLQLAVVRWVNEYIVGYSVWSVQGYYAEFHRDVFTTSGEFKKEAWIAWNGPREELCDAVMNKSLFLSVVLFLWFGRMIGELKLTLRLMREISMLPGSASDATILHCVFVRPVGEENKITEIIAMSTLTRFLVYTFIVIPKFVVAFVLLALGGMWLTATLSFSDLILNALALEFIIGIDENILSFFLPQRIAHRLDSTQFAYPINPNASKEDKEAQLISDYQRNIKYFLMCVVGTFAWVYYVQQVLPWSGRDIAQHCGEWFMNSYTAKCKPFEKECFPYGDASPPHDYGAMMPS